MAEVEHLTAAISLATESGEIPSEFVYLPEGTHEIQASVNGKAAKRTVTVGPESLAPLQEALKARLEKNVRPFLAFDHKETGPASFHPNGFHYESGRGVIVKGEWTGAGRKAIEGRDYSYFSPSFYRNKATGAPLGLPMHGEIGSLVNEPAFEAIERIAASHNQDPDMEQFDEIKAGLVKAALFTAEQGEKLTTVEAVAEVIKANLEASTKTAVDTAVAEATKDAPEASVLEKRVAELEGENKALTEQLSAKRAAEADEAIAEAVKAGRIPAQDEDTKAFWRESILACSTGKAKAQLAKLPGAEALKARRVESDKADDGPKGLARVEAAFKSSN